VLRALNEPEGIRDVLRRHTEEVARPQPILDRAVEELLAVIEQCRTQGTADSPAWSGAQLALARIYGEQSRWADAFAVHQNLRPNWQSMPELRTGLDGAFSGVVTEGERFLKQGYGAAALARFQLALEFVRRLLPNEGKRQADLLARSGCAWVNLGDAENARAAFFTSLELYRGMAGVDSGAALGTVCRSLLQEGLQFAALDDFWEQLETSSLTAPEIRLELAAARLLLSSFLDDLYRLSARSSRCSGWLTMVTPIAIEIEQSLVPPETDAQTRLASEYLPAMRARLQADMGLEIPSVRLRVNQTELPPATYLIMLDELPLVLGRVEPGMRFSPVSPQMLKEHGIPGSSVVAADHPLTDRPGSWVAPDMWHHVENLALELWPDPRMFMVFHLEATLRRNLGDFLGIQECSKLVESWSKTEAGAELVRAVLPGQVEKLRLCRVLRGLLRERTPIVRWQEILQTLRGTGLPDDDVDAEVRAVRLALKSSLPGNKPGTVHVPLPHNVESMIRTGLQRSGRKVWLALPPETTQQALGIIRSLVRPGLRQVLVTADSEVRPFVRRVAELEFPDLMVISSEEVISHAAASQGKNWRIGLKEARDTRSL
jgi:hypothetical protein